MILGRIDSRKSPLLQEILAAKNAPSENGFIIEGVKFVADCNPDSVRTVFLTNATKHADIASKFENVYEISSQVADKISSAVSGQEVIALVFKKNPVQPKKLILLDDVQDSGNVGTIIRTASAFGFGVVASEASANPYSVKTARSTAGAILSCFVQRACLERKIDELKKDGYYIYSTELDITATLLKNADPPEKFAVIIGNEGNGVHKEISALSNEKIYIPIKKENSLNASVAAGITMYVMGM